MSKKKLTNKEITEALGRLSDNDHILNQFILEVKQIFGLYLEYRKETYKESPDKFNDFVKAKVKVEQEKSRNTK